MRAELPWNVAGIPPEAREAARAAARREGLSVGEWLTRRILRGFSSLEDDTVAASGAPLDSWGLPMSAASRRDSEEMLARVGRTESESNEAWRRIEEQLKGLGRRLDSTERSHSENNRALSRTAQEMNISAREQVQVFDQLEQNIMGLNERLERLERGTANENIREAIKALHQGLSRLADQISATANNSAGQLAQVTTNLEKLATQLNQVWEDAEAADQLLSRRIDITEQELGQRIDDTQHVWEARLSASEKTAQFNTNALDHALEKVEAAASQRNQDLAEARVAAAQQEERAIQQQESIRRLQEFFAEVEAHLPKAGLEQRLDEVEHSLHGLADQMGRQDVAGKIDASLQALSFRLQKLEQEHAALLAELNARLSETETPPAPQPVEPPSFEPPPVTEPLPAFDFHEPPEGFLHPPENAPHQLEEHEPVDAFTPPVTPGGFAFDREDDHFASDLSDVFEDSEPDNFLAQARRSARTASEQAESEHRGRLSAFHGSQRDFAENEEKARPRFLIPLIVALLVVLAAAAALILSQRAQLPPVAETPSTAPKGPTFSVPPPPASNGTQFGAAPQSEINGQVSGQPNSQTNNQTDDQANDQTEGQAGNQTEGPTGNAKDFSSQRSEPGAADIAPRTVPSAPQREVHTQTVRPVPVHPAAAGAATKPNAPASSDRMTQLANAGNATALAILGLKALDNGNDTGEAVKFLTQAAEKGQAVAQYRLGTLYERGQGVTADPVKAMHWYELAANQGNRKAMHNLAVAYASAPAGKKNMTEAARWFAKAAALGLSDSQFNLAVLYERGDGVPQSLADAYKWYSIAAAGGDAESKARMNVLQTQLGEADRAAANRATTSFHAAPLNRSANVPPEAADLGN